MTKCRRARIDEQEKQIARASARAESIEREVARLKRRQLLSFEIRFRGIRTVIPQRHADDLLAGRSRRRGCALSLARGAFRNQPPGKFFYLRVGIYSCRSQKFFE